jgi:hypothetical protein
VAADARASRLRAERTCDSSPADRRCCCYPIGVPAAPSLFDIRKWRGTQQNAFEELCFQLRDPDPRGAGAVKPGTPDRGADWYVITASGDRLGRQCKFVDNIDAALPQMRESLQTALRELPDLVEMTFWVPFELAEATPPARRGGRRRSARERWDEAVARWLPPPASRSSTRVCLRGRLDHEPELVHRAQPGRVSCCRSTPFDRSGDRTVTDPMFRPVSQFGLNKSTWFWSRGDSAFDETCGG